MSTYITHVNRPHSTPQAVKMGVNLILSLLILFTGVFSLGGGVYANEQDLDSGYDDYVNELGIEGVDEENGRTKTDVDNDITSALIEDVNSKGINYYENPDNHNNIGYLIHRLLFKGYLNQTPYAVDIEGNSANQNNGINCDINDPRNGSLNYHNCDIPTIGTEIIQNLLFADYLPTIQGANVTSAKASYGFGAPTKLPGDGTIPLDLQKAPHKYTALELFGYNFNYTNYNGEWDHVKVNSGARALLNIGAGSGIKLGFISLKNAVVAGFNHTIDTASDWADEGSNILTKSIFGLAGLVWGVATAGESGLSAIINTYLDTADYNIMHFYSWYRPSFGETLYNARELSQEEKSLKASESFLKMFLEEEYTPPVINHGTPGEAQSAKYDTSSTIILGDSLMSDETTQEKLNTVISGATISASTTRQKQEALPILKRALEDNPNTQYVVISLYANDPLTEDDLQQYLNLLTETQRLVLVKGATTKDASDEVKNNIQETNKAIDIFAKTNEDKVRIARIDSVIETHGADLLGGDGLHFTSEEGKSLYVNEINRALNNWETAREQETRALEKWLDNKQQDFSNGEWLAKNPEYNFNAPWNQYVCTDSKGNDILRDNKPVPIYKPGTSILNDGCKPVRAPIQNGILGNGYTSDVNVPTDTRYTDNSDLLLPFTKDFVNTIANTGLNAAKFFTKISNFLIGLSFSPILETLGLNQIVLTVVDNFTEGIFFPLSTLAVAFSVIYIFFTSIRRAQFAQALKDIFKIAALFFIGVIILAKPANALALADDIPSKIENTLIGLMFNVDSVTGDNVCSASGDSDTIILSGVDGDLSFTKDSAVRTIQCEIWRAFVFTPYINGQWGTSYENLDNDEMLNTNGNLVGTGAVHMGGNIVINNWGLYQVDQVTSGNITRDDPSTPSGSIARDFYRIVDMQAGANNGEGTDSRFFHNWSGENETGRLFAGSFAGVTAFVGLLSIGFFSLIKIEATIVLTIMLLILPVMLLLGLVRGWGVKRFKQYIGTIISLIIKRVFSIFLLSFMLMLIVSLSMSTHNLFLNGVMVTAICLVFFFNRRQLTDFLTSSVSSASGGVMAQGFISNPRQYFHAKVPTSVRNTRGRIKTGVTSRTGGFIAGYTHGGSLEAAKHGAKQAARLEGVKTMRTQRRTGLGALTRLNDATSSARDEALNMVQKEADTGYNKSAVEEIVKERVRENVVNSYKRAQHKILKEQEDNGAKKEDKHKALEKEGLANRQVQEKADKVKNRTSIDWGSQLSKDTFTKLQELETKKQELIREREKFNEDLLERGENESGEELYLRRVVSRYKKNMSVNDKIIEIEEKQNRLYDTLANAYNTTVRREVNNKKREDNQESKNTHTQEPEPLIENSESELRRKIQAFKEEREGIKSWVNDKKVDAQSKVEAAEEKLVEKRVELKNTRREADKDTGRTFDEQEKEYRLEKQETLKSIDKKIKRINRADRKRLEEEEES